MSEVANVEERVMDHLDSLVDFMKAGTDFAVDQAPEIFHEIVAYGIASNLAYAFVWFAVLMATIKWYMWIWGRTEDASLYDDTRECCGAIALFVGSVSLTITIIQSIDVLKAIFAPRLFVMEYIANLVN